MSHRTDSERNLTRPPRCAPLARLREARGWYRGAGRQPLGRLRGSLQGRPRPARSDMDWSALLASIRSELTRPPASLGQLAEHPREQLGEEPWSAGRAERSTAVNCE